MIPRTNRLLAGAQIIGAALLCALQPSRLMHYAGMTPDPWQADYLDSLAQQQILCCSRQSGKSTTTGYAALAATAFKHNGLALLIAPSLRQSTELALKVKEHGPNFVILNSEIGLDPDKRNYIVRNQRLREAGFEARRSLDDGIRELLKSYRMMARQEFKNV